jgi:hypothetical protein
MATGENAGTWGDKTNSNLNLVQQAIAGYEAIALSDGGTVTLAMTRCYFVKRKKYDPKIYWNI